MIVFGLGSRFGDGKGPSVDDDYYGLRCLKYGGGALGKKDNFIVKLGSKTYNYLNYHEVISKYESLNLSFSNNLKIGNRLQYDWLR